MAGILVFQARSLGFQKSPPGKMAADKHKVQEVLLVSYSDKGNI